MIPKNILFYPTSHTLSTEFENASIVISSINNGIISVVPLDKMTLKKYTFYVVASRVLALTGSQEGVPYISDESIAFGGLTLSDVTYSLTITCGTWTNIPATTT